MQTRQALSSVRAGFYLLFLGLAGCGLGSTTGDLSGSVSYQGEPVRSGTVVFLSADGVKQYAKITPEGTYRIAEIPTGTVLIAVIPHQRNPFPSGKTEKPAPLPERYTDPKTSGITHDVRAGSQQFDIDLK
jgi:hypothetical protein